jgi:hypothetical protein
MPFRRLLLPAFTLLLPAAPAQAATPALSSSLYVERAGQSGTRELVPATTLARGERVITRCAGRLTMRCRARLHRHQRAARHLAWQQSAREDEEVSVDGGHSWGKLGTLRLDGWLATPEDVTHVRWHAPRSRRAGVRASWPAGCALRPALLRTAAAHRGWRRDLRLRRNRSPRNLELRSQKIESGRRASARCQPPAARAPVAPPPVRRG